MNSTSSVKITPIEKSKINSFDFENIVFGRSFTDHMFSCYYRDGEWETPEIMPYQKIELEPAARVFHYGQAVFEGMKAFKDDNDDVWLFRPEENIKRINKSAKRLAIPKFPEDVLLKSLKILVDLERNWIQKGVGNSLYIRPFVIATEPGISAAAAKEYRFMIICSPAKRYYTNAIKVLFAEKFSRSSNGGVGFAKAAGNYGAQFYPTSLALKKGYQQIIWTDASTHEFLEEAGTMNIFFRIHDTLITAPNNDRILDGITRKSVIQLAKDAGIDIEVRPIKVNEIKEAAKNNSLKEIFGSGTAAVITEISGFEHSGDTFDLSENTDNTYAKYFKDKLMGIQYNIDEDPYNWRVKV